MSTARVGRPKKTMCRVHVSDVSKALTEKMRLISVRDIGAASEVQYASVSRWLNGKQGLSREQVDRMIEFVKGVEL